MRALQTVSYAESQETLSSPTSSFVASPEQSPVSGHDVQLGADVDDVDELPSHDVIQSALPVARDSSILAETNPAVHGGTTAAADPHSRARLRSNRIATLERSPTRKLPARSSRSRVSYAVQKRTKSGTTQGTRTRSRLLSSDTTPTRRPRKSAPAKVETARGRVRQEIAEHTKPRRDAFFAAHSQYFLPLLPHNNYISRLERKVEDGMALGEPFKQEMLSSQPQGVKGTMKPYQLEGLSFLLNMYKNGMSAILGDEMGLGKTLQTLSLFQWLNENEPTDGETRPYLIVCPLSVLSSWIGEAKKWVPGFKVVRFHGPKTERDRFKVELRNHKSSVDILVTTYETFVSEQSWFRTIFVWRYVVLDEGHKIKNDQSNVSSALQGLSAEYRLLLTGTPIQNDLKEMWALLHWLYPQVFTLDTAEQFKKSFNLTAGKVSIDFMDHARRLLEIIMLRRMKNSPGVNLDLPPREEVLLFVPLTPMQKFWYTRLLTRIDQATLDEVFKSAKHKEISALESEDDDSLALLEHAGRVADAAHGAQDDVWAESKAIMKRAIEKEGGDTGNRQWTKLMNLIMQLRKACSHPYLLPGAQPDPYYLGDHVRTSSGKFIILDKLIHELVLKQRKKILIFSGFTTTLDLCEDLLALNGANDTNTEAAPFRFMRLDGSTQRAKRNLAIRMFNDGASNFRVMLLSTRAGGLGINLTSASDVVFLDEDWNPQVTLQAEARAHRIGQTKKVTVYKLCTQGTVEEQMMGRIRKKLYLSAKITESMRNLHTAGDQDRKRKRESDSTALADEGPQLGTSQLMTLLRRGAQTLSAPQVDVTEMISWDWETAIEKCKDRPQDPQVESVAGGGAHVDEQAWLNQMEKVETAIFDGKRHHRELDTAVKSEEDLSRAGRRQGKNTTVMVDGFAISKESMSCGDWEAVPTLAGKDPRLAEPKKVKTSPLEHQAHCQICWDGGEIYCCVGCPRSYHYGCMDKHFQGRAKTMSFYCPQHQCFDCEKKTAEAGNLIYRCRWCEKGYCEDCLDWDTARLIGETLPEYEMLHHGVTNAYFVDCQSCVVRWRNDLGDELSCKTEKSRIDREFAKFRGAEDGPASDFDRSVDTPDTVSEAVTPMEPPETTIKEGKKQKVRSHGRLSG